MNRLEYPFSISEVYPGLQTGLPFLPITLHNKNHSVRFNALVDSGSTANVLPFDFGVQLGLDWEAQTFPLPPLAGNLRGLPVFAVLLQGELEAFAPVPLAFAWTKSNDVPLILGQKNFFEEFDVHFFGSKQLFQIAPKQKDSGQTSE